ncbi:MAG TPA: hypothetical protein VE172_12840, partial [Stackebrandtia sp.]
MFYAWGIIAIAAACVSGYLTVAAMSRPPGLSAIARAIDAEPGRPSLRDGDLTARLAGQPAPRTVRVAGGSRNLRWVLTAGIVLAVATFVLMLAGTGLAWLVATFSIAVSAYLTAST